MTAQKLGYPVYNFKRIVRSMRKQIGVVESLMSAGKWDEIKYPEVPSRAMMIYRKAFMKHDEARFNEFIGKVEKGDAKINASTLFPYDIVEKFLYGRENSKVLEAQWKALPDYVEEGSNVLVMADVSGSMYGRPLATSIGLAIYFAERNVGAYHNLFMTFSGIPETVILRGETLEQKICNVNSANWGNNTDLEIAFERVLEIVISFINMKGGVGKTTLCIGIGEYLATYCKKKILFIDLDPQFTTTQSLINEFDLEDEYMNEYSSGDNNKTVMKLFQSQLTLAKKVDIPTPDDVLVKLNDNMDLLPGTINLILVESDKDGTKARKVKRFINENKLRDNYDFIFIDCPPTISVYTDAALIASDFYLVPNRIDRYSILGIKLLKQVIDRLDDNEHIGILPLGIVYTMIRDLTQKTLMLKETFEKDDIVKKIGLFSNSTSFVNDLLVGLQGNISSKYKKSREEIAVLCDEFLKKVEQYNE